jgi:hypothetical protein
VLSASLVESQNELHHGWRGDLSDSSCKFARSRELHVRNGWFRRLILVNEPSPHISQFLPPLRSLICTRHI